MSNNVKGPEQAERVQDEEKNLTGIYGAVQAGIWLIGLAILAWTGNWFPGILVLVAISGITQAVLQGMAKRQEQQAQVAETARAAAQSVPPNCPTCGAAISAATVTWTGPTTALCPYCKATVPLKPPPPVLLKQG